MKNHKKVAAAEARKNNHNTNEIKSSEWAPKVDKQEQHKAKLDQVDSSTIKRIQFKHRL